MNPFPSALLFLIPCISFSLSLLKRKILFVFISLGFLFIVAASLGLAACFDETHRSALNSGKQVVVDVIQFELAVAVLFIFADVVAPAIVSPKKILLYNAISFVFIDTSTILTLLSIFLSPTSLSFATPFVITLLSKISPLPLLAIILYSQPTRLNRKATRFWVILVMAQLFSVLYCIFHFLAAVSTHATFVYRVFESIFMILWATFIMINFHLLPLPNAEFNRTALRPRVTPSPSPSHLSLGRPGSPDASDFLNLRDPFASPPVSPISEKFSISPFGSPQNSQRFRSNKSKLSISSGAQTLFGSPPPSAIAMSFGNQKDTIGPLEDADFDQEEAILSQILLKNLDNQVNLPRERRVSESELVALGLGLGFGKNAEDKPRTKRKNLVIVTCERRGSESTIVAGSTDTICDSPSSQMTAFTSSPQGKTRNKKSSSSMVPSVSAPRTAQEYLQEGIFYHEANRLAESATCFEKSAKNGEGCCLGMVMWGLSLKHGWGCEQDIAEGFKWLEKAAASAVADLESNNSIGSEINGVQDSSFASSVSIYGLSENLISAIYDVGQCFFQGEGVRKDVKMSLFYYTISARAGAATLASYESDSSTKHSAERKERDLPPLPTSRPLSKVFDHQHLSMSPMSIVESLQDESEVEYPDREDDIDTPRALTPTSFIS